jgi:hypothetical protein
MTQSGRLGEINIRYLIVIICGICGHAEASVSQKIIGKSVTQVQSPARKTEISEASHSGTSFLPRCAMSMR